MPAHDLSPQAEARRKARALNNQQLSLRISQLQAKRRSYPRIEADAYLEEAARRLFWLDAYEKGALKGSPEVGD